MAGLLDYFASKPSANSMTGRALALLYPNGYEGGLLGQTPFVQQAVDAENADAARRAAGVPLGERLQAGLSDPMANNLAGFMGAIKPIRAFHGSPHNFDQFDTSKIGTGEGNQSFGHGLYFAENEGVAKAYRDNVKNMPAINSANARMSELAREMDKLAIPGQYRKFRDPRGYQLADEYDALMAEKMKPGHMYEVNIHADPQRMLDWDKPLGQQPAFVESAEKLGLKPARWPYSGYENDKFLLTTGDAESLYRSLGAQKESASKKLQEAGFPGIRYLDAGSRGSEAGTRNYVVFDPQIIEIVRKYGLLGPAMTGGGLLAAQE